MARHHSTVTFFGHLATGKVDAKCICLHGFFFFCGLILQPEGKIVALVFFASQLSCGKILTQF
jgi:hypothetical protein